MFLGQSLLTPDITVKVLCTQTLLVMTPKLTEVMTNTRICHHSLSVAAMAVSDGTMLQEILRRVMLRSWTVALAGELWRTFLDFYAAALACPRGLHMLACSKLILWECWPFFMCFKDWVPYGMCHDTNCLWLELLY